MFSQRHMLDTFTGTDSVRSTKESATIQLDHHSSNTGIMLMLMLASNQLKH